VAVIQDGRITANPGPEHRIAAGEVLVLVGNPQQVERALVLLDQGEEGMRAGDGEQTGNPSGGVI
jgi:K+/H+ antiporter YhaU regulatory subunit KhtT